MDGSRAIYVLIPVHNCIRYLQQAVDSVLSQPYSNLNICIIDDGSNDGSSELCDKLAAECGRIHVIHQKNSGVSVARNIGIAYVLSVADIDSDYIGFCDADDIWHPMAIRKEIFVDELPQLSLPQIFAFGTVNGNHQFTRFSNPITYEPDEKKGKDSVWKVRGTFGACLYSIKVLHRWGIRFPEDLHYNEDKIFLMQMIFFSEKIRFMPQCLYVYRKNPSSAMHKVQQIPSTEYWLPMINGWVRSDDYMNSFAGETHQEIHAGHILAGIYLLDMAADHFKQGRKASELFEVLYHHPHFDLLQNMRPQDVSAKQYKNSRLLLEHPRIFEIKYRICGIGIKLARLIVKIPIIQFFLEKRNYPNTSPF